MSSPRKNIMLGTAGHVDHGKTALVKLLTGCDTDRLAAEKQRGLTIELGFAPCKMRDERIVGIVDVPGHVDFIRNMVSGAHGIDVVVLVVAGDDGVMPQTREHLDILTLMGARHGIVALTKTDMVDSETLELVTDDVREFLTGTFLEGAPLCPVSNITGEGFDGFFAALNAAVSQCKPCENTGLFRLWIERTFHIRGFGTVVSGIPTSGEVHVEDKLRLLPEGSVGRVRKLEVYGEEAAVGRAGECVAINLTDIAPETMDRGMVLCESDAFEGVTMAEAQLRLLDYVPGPLKDYAEVHLHIGTAEAMGNVAILADGQISPGATQMVQLRLKSPLGVAPGDRFVIRSSIAGLGEGRVTTIGGGRILGTSNLRFRRNRPWTLANLTARRDAIDSPSQWCALHLREAAAPLTPAALARRAQMRLETVKGLLESLQSEGIALSAGGDTFIHRDLVGGTAERIKQTLEEFHAANPMRLGLSEGDMGEQVQSDKRVLELALRDLVEEKTIQRQGELVALTGRKLQISEEDRELCEQIEAKFREAHLEPQSPLYFGKLLGVVGDRLNRIVQLLEDQGKVVRLDPRVVMHRDAVEAAKKVALDLFAKSASFETVQFRDALGVSRKYAIPLLDYFDTIHLTVRSGSRRTPGTVAKEWLEGRKSS